MKRRCMTFAVVLMAACVLFNSCIGSFPLFHKVLAWNKKIGGKFVNELVFIVCNIIPVYAVAGLIDVFVMNSIEFWGGNTGVAANNVGKTQKVVGSDGKQYLVKTLRDGYKVTKPDGQIVTFAYNKADSTWSVLSRGKKAELFKMNADGTAQITLESGQKLNVTLDAAGIYEARQAVNGATYYAMR